jgi:hypothetical protein
MNWRRGLLRLWILASVCWLITIGWFAYQDWWLPRQAAFDQQACIDLRTATRAGNPFDCFDKGVKFDDLIPIWRIVSYYLLLALGPAIAVFVFGVAVIWVLTGFTRDQDRTRGV